MGGDNEAFATQDQTLLFGPSYEITVCPKHGSSARYLPWRQNSIRLQDLCRIIIVHLVKAPQETCF